MANKTKIQIKSSFGSVLFEHETEDNTIKKTLEKAVLRGVDLRGADLRGADLSDVDLSGAVLSDVDLRGADLSGADLSGAVLSDVDLRGADLSGADLSGADLSGAVLSDVDLSDVDLSGAVLSDVDLSDADLSDVDLSDVDLRGIKDFKKLPQQFVNLCSRDMLFTFEHLKEELPFLKEKILKGEVNGSQYEGNCACLIGTIAKNKGNGNGLENVCKAIPYYDKGTHNMSETWFLSIHEGDTPKNSIFAKHAVKLIDEILKCKKTNGLKLMSRD